MGRRESRGSEKVGRGRAREEGRGKRNEGKKGEKREGERGMPARREEMRGKRQGGNGRREVEKAKRGKWKSKGWAGGRDILLIYIPSSL